jgi:hypothetical protein
MSHFAEIDENNVVLRVLVGDNDMPNEGYDWFVENLGGTWIKTSYNGSIRKNYAGIGYTYNEELDAFIPPKPYESWILNESTCLWQSPIPQPQDGRAYEWNEESLLWVELEPSSEF